MCLAVRFRFDEKDWQVRFTQYGAQLPVITRSGHIQLLSWGRRKRDRTQLPMGGWARLTHIQSGRWNAYQPKPVRIAANAFMEQDVMGNEQWHRVTEGNYLQGLLATTEKERRVYVVILECGPDENHYERWPRVVSSPGKGLRS